MLVPQTLLGWVQERILQAGGAERTTSLMLDEIPLAIITPEIKEEIQKCTKVEYFSMDTCLLTSLENFPDLPRLQVLQLNNNNLHDEDLKILLEYPKLRRIFIRENKLSSVDALKQLSTLMQLIQIQLKGNPVAETPALRDTLYTSLKNLEIIDGKDRQGNDMQDITDYSEENNSGQEEEGSSIQQSQNEQEDQEAQDVVRKQRKLN